MSLSRLSELSNHEETRRGTKKLDPASSWPFVTLVVHKDAEPKLVAATCQWATWLGRPPEKPASHFRSCD
jgi:hypothetical protein